MPPSSANAGGVVTLPPTKNRSATAWAPSGCPLVALVPSAKSARSLMSAAITRFARPEKPAGGVSTSASRKDCSAAWLLPVTCHPPIGSGGSGTPPADRVNAPAPGASRENVTVTVSELSASGQRLTATNPGGNANPDAGASTSPEPFTASVASDADG